MMFHAYFMPTGDLQPSVDILALEHSHLDTDAISSVVLIIALTILSQN